MSRFLDIEAAELERTGSYWTAREICQQPGVWRQASARIQASREAIDAWLAPSLKAANLRIVLCGAGTSAHAAECIAAWLRREYATPPTVGIEAVSATDLTADPLQHFSRDLPTLLVSFARSGDSPESLACIDLAGQLLSDCRHLVITCNPDGALARYARDEQDALCLIMPDGTNDRGFAMTSSYTAMVVACLAIFTPDDLQLGVAAQAAQRLVDRGSADVAALARRDFDRLVVLGNGCLRGTAQEAALKCLELTAGHVVALHESPLGFRHGPKILINESTLVVHLCSTDARAVPYERDLLRELHRDSGAAALVELSADSVTVGAAAPGGAGPAPLEDAWLSLVYIVYCQMLAFFKALAVGVQADNPCPTGEVNRVVNGVEIHSFDFPHHPPRTGAGR